MSLRRRLLAVFIVLLAALAAAPLQAMEPAAGSKNFSAPRSVPDYFSNESGPFHTGASARAARPGPAGRFAAPMTDRATSVAARRHRGHRARRMAAISRHHRYRRLARRRVGTHGHAVHFRAARSGRMTRTRAAHARHRTAHLHHHFAHHFAHHLAGHRGRGKVVAVRGRHRPASRSGKRIVPVRG